MTDNKTYQPFKTILLSDEGFTLGEYIEKLLCSDNVPAAIIMSEANISLMSDVPSIEMLVSTDETMEELERKQTPVQNISSGIVLSGDASFDDNTLLLTYAKRADTQGISGASIMDEMNKLFTEVK
ncbi:hypothetical protein [Pseudoalteromonas phage vB_PalP_Y7]|nr:hypothetical protein [Pseudoalteromonas phage vB_PalP_Y7]